MNDKTRTKTGYFVFRLKTPAKPEGATKSTQEEEAVRIPAQGALWEALPGPAVIAANAAAAVRAAAGEDEGEYFAVPARSFVPVTVKVETRTVVKLT